MTIKRQRVNNGALVEVEADNTDTVDTNGFSDSIQAVGAETAQFSDTSTMKANNGLRIGLTQLKINTGGEVLRVRSINSAGSWANTANMIDGNDLTFGQQTGDGGSPVVIDFTSPATNILKYIAGKTITGAIIRITTEISDDNISYTSLGEQGIVTETGTTIDLGTQTWRFVRMTFSSQTPVSPDNTAKIFEVFEETAGTTPAVTVRVRSSATQDTANGSVLISDQVMEQNETLTFTTELLLTGNGQFVTLEIVSFNTTTVLPVTLSEITSILEES